MKQVPVVIRGMSAFEAQRQEELLKQIRVEDTDQMYTRIFPFQEDDTHYITLRKPLKRGVHLPPLYTQVRISPIDHRYYPDDAERLGLALQQAAELARVFDAKFKEEHGL